MTQKKAVGLSTCVRYINPPAYRIWRTAYSRSAFTQRSAMTPKIVGMMMEAMPIVAKMEPNEVPSHCFVPNQYLAIVINQAPHTKNCRKLMMMSLIFIDICYLQ